jgi:hypothetical protein
MEPSRIRSVLSRLVYTRPVSNILNRYYDLKEKSVESFIFVATTGRSGTLTLVDIFRQLDGCVALHEPYPAMHDNVLEAAANGNYKFVEQFYKVRKSVNVRRSAVGASHYIEANHLFIKTFIQYAAEDFGSKLKVIHLVRNPTQVANSIYSLQDEPGTIEGNRWWLDYRAPTNLISIVDSLDDDSEFSHPYYKALWYWFETEARIAKWKAKLTHVPFVFFKTEDFSNELLLTKLLEDLDIEAPPGFIQNMVNIRSHARSNQKKVPPLPPDHTEEMLERFTQLLRGKGLSIPDTLYEYR